MKINEIVKYHPSIVHPKLMQDLIKPLKKLGICYFSHARINEKGFVATNASDPAFLSTYYQEGWYQYDLHNATLQSGKRYFLWDLVTRVGKSEELYQLAVEFGMCHTFTIIEQTDKQKDLYHFVAPHGNHYMNEFYLQHIDLLEQFVAYFKDQLLINDLLNRAYTLCCKPSKDKSGYFIREKELLLQDDVIAEQFLNAIDKEPRTNPNNSLLQIPRREMQCAFLLLQGKTTKEISDQLSLSPRTVEIYFERLKQRFGSKNKIQLAHHITQAALFK